MPLDGDLWQTRRGQEKRSQEKRPIPVCAAKTVCGMWMERYTLQEERKGDSLKRKESRATDILMTLGENMAFAIRTC